jgi:hypothetical protein
MTLFPTNAEQNTHTDSADTKYITTNGIIPLRNFRKANLTRRTVMVGISIAVMALAVIAFAGNQHATAQTSNGRDGSKDVSLELLTIQDSDNDAETEGKPEEDKWALTDEDRMSDEEMDEELFGKSEKSSKSIDAEDDDENSESPIDKEEEDASSESDDSPATKKAPARLAPRQTIETYLRGINTLTVDTYTPPSSSLDGVDVPMRLTPPQTYSATQNPTSATLRFQTPDIHHQPLYFEDQNLERYGVHRYRLQPIESARQFASDVISLPREVRSVPPNSCVYRANQRYNQPSLIPANR